MEIRTTVLSLTLAGSVAISFAAAAGVPNPDNDSGNYFASKGVAASSAAPTVAATLPAYGTISEDGLYEWRNPDKGWVARGYSYIFTDGHVEHAQDCVSNRVTGGRTAGARG